jgi:hypothetical protein
MDGAQQEGRPGQDASEGNASPEYRQWRGHVTARLGASFLFH